MLLYKQGPSFISVTLCTSSSCCKNGGVTVGAVGAVGLSCAVWQLPVSCWFLRTSLCLFSVHYTLTSEKHSIISICLVSPLGLNFIYAFIEDLLSCLQFAVNWKEISHHSGHIINVVIFSPNMRNLLPSGSSSGGTSKLWWAIMKACRMFSTGSRWKLSLRSTMTGFMDLTKARNAKPLLQLFPKSFTSTPYLQKV